MAHTVQALHAWEVLDSRGHPTVACRCTLASGHVGESSVPSGASTGRFEAFERRDGDPSRYGGCGVLGVVDTIHHLVQTEVCGRSWDQVTLDDTLVALDGSPQKTHLGANALLAVSCAFAHAVSAAERRPLCASLRDVAAACGVVTSTAWTWPMPLVNVINGGAHANNGLDVQEMMLVPVGATSFPEAVRWVAEVFHALRASLAEAGASTAVGDEGGFAPRFASHEEGFDTLLRAIERAGYRPGVDMALALDVASSEFYSDGRYHLATEQRTYGWDTWLERCATWAQRYPIVSLEDPMAEDDVAGWQGVTERLGQRHQLVGDDVFVTQRDRLEQGVQSGVANAVLIKPNQVGTLTETLRCIASAQQAGYRVIVSHRSGETQDTTVADLAMAVAADQIKAGAPCRGERVVKYNRLLALAATLEGQSGSNAGCLSGWPAEYRVVR